MKINLINEVARVTSNCKLMSIEKGPISASVVLYFQHDDAARKLVFVYLFICFTVVEGETSVP